MARRPKRDRYVKNHDIALRNLRDNLDDWHIVQPRGVPDGVEYGDDWRVTVVDSDGDVRGDLEFAVQSKVITSKRKVNRSRICDDFDVTTLTYLAKLAVPTLIHLVEEETREGYVCWLDEWIESSECPSDWHNRKRVRISIPKSTPGHRLSADAIRKRLELIANDQDALRLRNKMLKMLGDQHFLNELHDPSNPNQTIYQIVPKSNATVPVLRVSEGEYNSSLIELAVTGRPQRLRGSVWLDGSPLAGIIPGATFVSAHLFLNDKDADPEFNLRIELFDEGGASVLLSPVVAFRRIQPGHPVTYGNDTKQRVRYTLISGEGRVELKIRSLDDLENNSSASILARYRLLQRIHHVRSWRIKHLETERVFLSKVELSGGPSAEEIEYAIRCVEAVEAIELGTNVRILLPEQITFEQVEFAEKIAGIISTGRYDGILDIDVHEKDASLLIELPEELREEFELYVAGSGGEVRLPGNRWTAKVFGQAIELGSSVSTFPDFEIVRVEHPEVLGSDGQAITRFVARFDPNGVYSTFEKFLDTADTA